jgi:hypothetical protein
MKALISFVARAFSENGQPSSSRILSAWLSVSSMALIWFIVRHMQGLPVEKLQPWVAGLPYIIGSLATFAVSPYGVTKVTGMFRKAAPKKDDETT